MDLWLEEEQHDISQSLHLNSDLDTAIPRQGNSAECNTGMETEVVDIIRMNAPSFDFNSKLR